MDDTTSNIIDACLRGEKIYGDDFTPSEIAEWFADEAEGYFDIASKAKSAAGYEYEYTAQNIWHGFSKLPQRQFRHAVGIGAADGAELRPVLRNCDLVTILEPSSGFVTCELDGTPLSYVKPHPSGEMPFATGSVDLITCFGVLHHIPNVSRVLAEFGRVLSPGGYALVREPIISMGDWRHPRPGLTRRERGIPPLLLRKAAEDAELVVASQSLCEFALSFKLKFLSRRGVFNSRSLVALDSVLSALPIWSRVYHPSNVLQKLRPMSIFLVLHKPAKA